MIRPPFLIVHKARALVVFALLVLALPLLGSCAALRPGTFDPIAAANDLHTYQLDVRDLAPLASTDTAPRILELADRMAELEDALRRGQPSQGLAQTVLDLADAIAREVDPEGQTDLRLVGALARIALRHALPAPESPPAEEPAEPIPPQA